MGCFLFVLHQNPLVRITEDSVQIKTIQIYHNFILTQFGDPNRVKENTN